ncbi:MAG: hypothetical protein AAFQ89_19675, partial [Cyanobacteria bacterium J06626_18]
IRTALSHYEDVANITFQEKNSGGTLQFGYAQTFADLNGDDEYTPVGGLGGFPRASGSASVVVDRDTTDFSPGRWGYLVWLHELGHAAAGLVDVTMGRNPGDKYSDAYEKLGTGMDGQTLSAAQDSTKYTVMSYNDHPDMPGVHPRTLMLYDIAAVQALYGANWSHNSGNTTYSWDLNETFVETIWDGGGFDTIDASNQTRRSVINLRAGSFSSIGSYNGYRDAAGNLAIAYGATIESAKGGWGDDVIVGNEVGNYLYGNAGNDTIAGLDGNDHIYGHDGDDVLSGQNDRDYIYGGNDDDRIYGDGGRDLLAGGDDNDILYGGSDNDLLFGGKDQDTLHGGEDDDVLYGQQGNDYLYGNTGEDTLYGNNGNDVLNGGADRDRLYGGNDNDHLYGEGGNDYLNGGSGGDFFAGGMGDDLYVVDDAGDTVTEYAGAGNDKVEASVSYTLNANVENLLMTGSAAIDGTGNSLDNQLLGNGANNQLNGKAGKDIIRGKAGRDRLFGDAGNDELFGDAGNDELFGGDGKDFLMGFGGTPSIQPSNSTQRETPQQDNDLTYSGSIDSVEFSIGSATLLDSSVGTLLGGADKTTLEPYYKLFGEYDTLTGGSGFDTFVLGNHLGSFYKGAGYAVITDFTTSTYKNPIWGSTDTTLTTETDTLQFSGALSNHSAQWSDALSSDVLNYNISDRFTTAEDTIQVYGSLSNYTLDYSTNWGGSADLDTAIYQGNDLIGVVQDNTKIFLTDAYFTTVSYLT